MAAMARQIEASKALGGLSYDQLRTYGFSVNNSWAELPAVARRIEEAFAADGVHLVGTLEYLQRRQEETPLLTAFCGDMYVADGGSKDEALDEALAAYSAAPEEWGVDLAQFADMLRIIDVTDAP